VARGEVIEEEQGFGAADNQVIDAHGYEVNPHSTVVHAIERHFELGAHPVSRAHEHYIAAVAAARGRAAFSPEASRRQVEEAPEAPEVGVTARAAGGLGKRRRKRRRRREIK